MSFLDSLLLLAGFALTHAGWSISDIPPNESLVPFVIFENAGSRELIRFEAETQVEAIAQAKVIIADDGSKFTRWVFVREGTTQEGNKRVDVLTVEAKYRSLGRTIIFVQPYSRDDNGLKFIGQPTVAVDGQPLAFGHARVYLEGLAQGVQSHPRAAMLDLGR